VTATDPRVTVDVRLTPDELHAALEADVRAGLTASPKTLPPTWFYDERGSRLFEAITELPEYYPTRTERALLERHAAEIVARAGADTLVELGSGTSEKTRLLLDAMAAAGSLEAFAPFDVSEQTLRDAAAAVSADYGDLPVHAVVGDFHRHLDALPTGGRRMVAFLGGTIGNLTPAERERFFFDLDAGLMRGDSLLLATDLVKDPDRLVAAYDDRAGVTAAFNRNVLQVLNNELGADFDPERFEHVARWNPDDRWIEMWLRSLDERSFHLAALDLSVRFRRGEALRTEISAKFTPEQVAKELWAGGFVVEATWTDPAGDYLLTLATPHC
jgi:L-histidine Nalpha-methyltransferase